MDLDRKPAIGLGLDRPSTGCPFDHLAKRLDADRALDLRDEARVLLLRPARACAEVLADEQGETVARAVRELYRELALIPREALSDVEIAEILRSEVARAKAGRG